MQSVNQQRSYTISCLRIFSMLLILLCHVIKYYTFIPGSSHINQFFNVGVQVFLLISGYLQGRKEVVNYGNWMYKKAKRIWLPVIFVVAFDVIMLAIMHTPTDTLTIIMYLLNLHGLLFLNWNFFGNAITEIPNLGPLWFTTMIMLCYIIIPVLQIINKKCIKESQKPINKCVVLLCVLYAVVLILSAARVVDLSYILLFIVGYCFGMFSFNKDHTCIKHELLLSVVMVILQFIRVVLRVKYAEFQYYATYTIISHAALGIWIFYTGFFIEKNMPNLVRKIADNRVLKCFDSYSYFIYLVHGLFCMGIAFNVYIIIDNILVSSLLFISLTLAAAFALRFITKTTERILP